MVLCRFLLWVFLILWGVANVYEACTLSSKEMYEELIARQHPIGMIAGNLFYAPAWLLKFYKMLIK